MSALTVGKLKEALKDVDNNSAITIDYDNNGYYNLEKVEITPITTDDEKEEVVVVNLVSSNEL